MNISLMSFSGRNKDGNCLRILDYVNDHLDSKYNITKMKTTELKISPCLNCDYECFDIQLRCPKEQEDDVTFIYDNLINSDISIMTIPVYSAAPPATYFALRERSQSIITSEAVDDSYNNTKKLYILIGNTQAGALEAMTILLSESKNSKQDDVLLLESSVFGQKSTAGKLIEDKAVQDKIYDFLLRHKIEVIKSEY